MIFYESFYEACKGLSAEDRAQAYDAIIAYGCAGIEPQGLGTIPQIIFTMAKPLMDANKERKANGAKGGRPKKDANPTQAATPQRTTGKFINFAPSGTNWDTVADQIMAAQK